MKLTKKEQDKLNKQLLDAIEQNDLEVVEVAVEDGADVNARSKDGQIPLVRSAKYFVDIKIMEFLLEHGANPNLQNEYGNTALHHISSKGGIAKAKLLFEYNADMYIKNKRGRTPFAEALYWKEHDVDVAELYVLNGYTPTEEDFEVIVDNGKQTEVKAQFMELARTVKVNAVQQEAESEVCCDEVCCDEVFDF